MTLRVVLASGHLIALAIGLGAVYARWRALRALRRKGSLQGVFHADNWYGVATLLWLMTGLFRAFGSFEKGSDHYLSEPLFLTKMGMFALVGLLETYPMVMLIRWRKELRKGRTPDLSAATLLSRLTLAELPLLLSMVVLAAMLARGL